MAKKAKTFKAWMLVTPDGVPFAYYDTRTQARESKVWERDRVVHVEVRVLDKPRKPKK